MAFTSKNLHAHKSGMTFIKWATFFFLGMSCVLFMTKAFEIEPATRNAVQLIQKIIFTTDGDASSTQMISIDGSWGNASFAGTVSADTLSGNTVCIGSDCQTSWPTSVGGDSVWSTWASSVAYYNLGNVGIGTSTPSTKLTVNGSINLQDKITFNAASSIYPIDGDDFNGNNLTIHAANSVDFGGGPWAWGKLYLLGGNSDSQDGIWWDVVIMWWTWGDQIGWNIYINWWYSSHDLGNIILGNLRGKVGIGTSTPLAILTVNGGIKALDKNTDPCSNTWTYPAWTMFYVPSHGYSYYCTDTSGTVWCTSIVMPDMYCMCNSDTKAIPINGRYIHAASSSNQFAATCFNP